MGKPVAVTDRIMVSFEIMNKIKLGWGSVEPVI
jgi:hypothetical protein